MLSDQDVLVEINPTCTVPGESLLPSVLDTTSDSASVATYVCVGIVFFLAVLGLSAVLCLPLKGHSIWKKNKTILHLCHAHKPVDHKKVHSIEPLSMSFFNIWYYQKVGQESACTCYFY